MQKIMFNDKYGLTQAVLEGRKTQTRRIPDIQPPYENSEICFPTDFLLVDEPEKHPLWLAYCWRNKDNPEEFTPWVKPRYKEGEIVAVAQSYKDCGGLMKDGTPRWEFISQFVGFNNKGWYNKMYVRPDLMPHQIRITKVRMQRLQDISDDDCLAEGIEKVVQFDGISRYYVKDGIGERLYATDSPQDAYAFLIDRVGKKGTWEKNPWVWVYDFELIK